MIPLRVLRSLQLLRSPPRVSFAALFGAVAIVAVTLFLLALSLGPIGTAAASERDVSVSATTQAEEAAIPGIFADKDVASEAVIGDIVDDTTSFNKAVTTSAGLSAGVVGTATNGLLAAFLSEPAATGDTSLNVAIEYDTSDFVDQGTAPLMVTDPSTLLRTSDVATVMTADGIPGQTASAATIERISAQGILASLLVAVPIAAGCVLLLLALRWYFTASARAGFIRTLMAGLSNIFDTGSSGSTRHRLQLYTAASAGLITLFLRLTGRIAGHLDHRRDGHPPLTSTTASHRSSDGGSHSGQTTQRLTSSA